MCDKCNEIEELIKPRLDYYWASPTQAHKNYGEFGMLNNINKILHCHETDKDILLERGVIHNG